MTGGISGENEMTCTTKSKSIGVSKDDVRNEKHLQCSILPTLLNSVTILRILRAVFYITIRLDSDLKRNMIP